MLQMSSIGNYNTSSLADFYTKTAIPNAPKHTGRLPLSGEDEKLSIPKAGLYVDAPHIVPGRISEQIQFRHTDTPLNRIFFSQGNIEQLQGLIQSTVQQMIGATIDRQSDSDLMLIMRSYYLQYARNEPNRLSEELDDLNKRVVNFSANRIAVEVEAYRYFRKDIMDFPAPISLPIDTHVYGTRVGELKSFF